MTATPSSTASIAVGTTLKLAFELGSTKWTLGFTTAPAQRHGCGRSPPGIWWRGATPGVRIPLTGKFLEQLATAHTGDGRPLAVAFRTRLEHVSAWGTRPIRRRS